MPSMLMDLRPCYEGYAGIPQETRLLFALFGRLGLPRFGGLLSGIHFTSRHAKRRRTPSDQVIAQAQALISQDSKRQHWPSMLERILPGGAKRRLFKPVMALSEMWREERLDLAIDPSLFEDFIWTKLFEKTLPPADRVLVPGVEYFATELGHEYARSLSLFPSAFQRRVRTHGWDVFFGASVSPYQPAPRTRMMIRYYDALPLLSPHTVGEPWAHALSHARMLTRNVARGATFVCDSEPVREDVLRLFPQAEGRVLTIPALIAADFWPERRPERDVEVILERRASAATKPAVVRRKPPASLPRLIMAVSTLEPRKNYLRLFHAFEIARRMTSQAMQLVIVANPGWRSELEMSELKALVKEGGYHVSGVLQSELRILYSMAHLVVAPSRAEGFDYSGVEAMACGTPLIASDIPVHRWVYGQAAEYFDPYDQEELARWMVELVQLPRETGALAEMSERGLRQARLYQADNLAPRWEAALARMVRPDEERAQQARRGMLRTHAGGG